MVYYAITHAEITKKRTNKWEPRGAAFRCGTVYGTTTIKRGGWWWFPLPSTGCSSVSTSSLQNVYMLSEHSLFCYGCRKWKVSFRRSSIWTSKAARMRRWRGGATPSEKSWRIAAAASDMQPISRNAPKPRSIWEDSGYVFCSFASSYFFHHFFWICFWMMV